MSPRAVPNRSDPAAVGFLDAAAQLIDAVLAPSPQDPPPGMPRLRFPAALEWLRVEDVVRTAQEAGRAGCSRRAFHNRWHGKDDFINDAVLYALLYRDDPGADPAKQYEQLLGVLRADTVSGAMIQIADDFLDKLLGDPRSYLLLHIGPLLDQHPTLRNELIEELVANRVPWYRGYGQLIKGLGLTLRPGWTVERIGMALQTLLDGFVFRSRLQRDDMATCRWEGASLFADTVVTFTLGLLDCEASGLSSRQALDSIIGRSTGA